MGLGLGFGLEFQSARVKLVWLDRLARLASGFRFGEARYRITLIGLGLESGSESEL